MKRNIFVVFGMVIFLFAFCTVNEAQEKAVAQEVVQKVQEAAKSLSQSGEAGLTQFDKRESPFAQPVPAPGAGNSFSALPSAQATTAKAAIDRPVTAQQTSDEQKRSTILIWIGAVLVWIGAIGLYARGPTKHLTRKLRSQGFAHSHSWRLANEYGDSTRDLLQTTPAIQTPTPACLALSSCRVALAAISEPKTPFFARG